MACFELLSISSLNEDFLPQYANCMTDADIALVYYNPEMVRQNGLNEIEPKFIKAAFGGDNLTIYTDPEAMQQKLRELDYRNSTLLIMTSGDFSGTNLKEFAGELLQTVK